MYYICVLRLGIGFKATPSRPSDVEVVTLNPKPARIFQGVALVCGLDQYFKIFERKKLTEMLF